MKSAREMVSVVGLAIVFIGGLALLARPESSPVKHKAAATKCGAVRNLLLYIDPPDPCYEGVKKTPPKEVRPYGTVPPRSDPEHSVTQPGYPPESKRLGEMGTVIMLLTVETDGHVSAAAVDRTSGHDRLDQAAMEEALKWRLLPGTIDGKPTRMQYKFAVTFKITD